MENIKKYKITLLNNDDLDILYVIGCLMKVCKYESLQAEQCALITHHKGSYDIFSGEIDDVIKITEHLESLRFNLKISEICT